MNTEYLKKRILILDDDKDDYIIISDYIKLISGNNFIIDWCNKYEEGIKLLLDSKYDLFFVDYRLGAKTGLDFLKTAKQNNCDEPIVLLTGMGNYNIDIQSMQYGAVDYLVKTDLTTEKLERCIRYAIGRSTSLKALKENEKKYRSIFEKSKDIVFVTNCIFNFIDVNPAIKSLLGYEKEAVIDKCLLDIIDSEYHYVFWGNSFGRASEINDAEVVIIAKNGNRINCTLSLAQELPNNEKSNYQGIIHDITNLKMMEKANIQTEKLAATGRLLRTLAHEVRNPLNNISLSSKQLQNYTYDENIFFYLDIINRNTSRINDLITELLNTSSPEINKPDKHTLQIIVDDVIAASLDRLSLKHIKLDISYPEAPIFIMADRSNLKLALLNIFTNAIESMQDNVGKLSVSIENNLKKAVLLITDNGCGISEVNITRLFEPFFTQKRGGVGLGLTYTLNILRAHNAQIEVKSKENIGTVFKISFQLA